MGDSSSSTEMVVPSANEGNFGFAFNDYDFSDRLLRLEIVADDSFDARKKLRVEKYHEWFSCIHADHSKDSESSVAAKVETLHISSLVLAAKSPFFYKLFKNGMRESQSKNDVSLRINASEEATLMDLLHFMYGNALSATSAPDLVDVLIAADKFEVTSCMRHCVEMLLEFPMSLESAVFYLELPSSVLVSEIVKPLIDAAKEYVVARYRDFTKSQEEAMELPLSAVEVVLGSEGLQVVSEDDIFDFILKWARGFYPEPEERREILTKRLARLIRFPNMSSSKLKEVLEVPDFDQEQVSKLVMEALFSKVEVSCGQHIHASKDLATTNCGFGFGFTRRVYSPRCVVYFDLKRDELKSLLPSEQLTSHPFCLGGKWLRLVATRCVKEQKHHHLGLFVHKEQETETCTLDFEFAVMEKSSKEFKRMRRFNNRTLKGIHGQGTTNLLRITWTEFMSDDSEYFVNDILHLRARITICSKD